VQSENDVLLIASHFLACATALEERFKKAKENAKLSSNKPGEESNMSLPHELSTY